MKWWGVGGCWNTLVELISVGFLETTTIGILVFDALYPRNTDEVRGTSSETIVSGFKSVCSPYVCSYYPRLPKNK